MKHAAFILGCLIIMTAAIAAGVGSYRSHDYHLQTMPHDTPMIICEIVEPTALEETVRDIEEPVQEDEHKEQFIPPDLPMIREDTFVNLTYEEQDLLLSVAMAEAEGEDSVGKALVMITVLNRTQEYSAPVGEIIYAKSQFCTSRMGIQPGEDCYEALGMVIDGWNESYIEGDWDHTKKILWFSADGYPPYGEPLFRYGGHYFSGI